ncbi:MAG: alpha-glucan family phosphorylase, partial [Candidatus Pacebacteria bacterium]|nr:alpha-glucan family phosphorylase [Candidatus Paceibacterota bacterium]
VFLEDYDLHTAKHLVHGVDVWLNTPRRPYEASGTSGQKAAMNAGINLSVADGWWYEGAEEGNGWTIGPGSQDVDENTESDDLRDVSDLYDLLEDVVVPLYYQRNTRGVPEQWMSVMRRSLETALPRFNTHRMVKDYFDSMYKPCAARSRKATADNHKMIRELAEWKRRVSGAFSTVHLVDITTSGARGGCIQTGQTFGLTVRVDTGDLSADELLVELVVGKTDPVNDIRDPKEIALKYKKDDVEGDRIVSFKGEFKAENKGNYSYGIRIIPYHKDLANKFDMGLVMWA